MRKRVSPTLFDNIDEKTCQMRKRVSPT